MGITDDVVTCMTTGLAANAGEARTSNIILTSPVTYPANLRLSIQYAAHTSCLYAVRRSSTYILRLFPPKILDQVFGDDIRILFQ